MAETNHSPYAHNLVNSLYVMKGLLESFFREHPEGNGVKAHEPLERAYGQANQALSIAKRLEEMAMCEQKRDPARLSHFKVSVKASWRRTLGLLKKDFSFDHIEILERIPEPFPLICCHPADFEETLYHLLRNSVEAMREKGTLVVRAHLSLSSQQEPIAIVHLADTGPGISEPVFSRLFLPFSSTKKSNGGTGLGLFLTRQLVRRNAGRIIVSSFEGFGTTFTLELPLAER